MIEPDGNTARCNEHRHAVAFDECPCVIDFKSTATQQFDREGSKRIPFGQGLKQLVETVGIHDNIIRSFGTIRQRQHQPRS